MELPQWHRVYKLVEDELHRPPPGTKDSDILLENSYLDTLGIPVGPPLYDWQQLSINQPHAVVLSYSNKKKVPIEPNNIEVSTYGMSWKLWWQIVLNSDRIYQMKSQMNNPKPTNTKPLDMKLCKLP